MSNNQATQPPAVCLNVEEIGKVSDEVFAYLILQGKDLLDDYIALSFKETREKMDDYVAPFTHRQFFCSAIIDENSNLPRAPATGEYFRWIHSDGRPEYQNACVA